MHYINIGIRREDGQIEKETSNEKDSEKYVDYIGIRGGVTGFGEQSFESNKHHQFQY